MGGLRKHGRSFSSMVPNCERVKVVSRNASPGGLRTTARVQAVTEGSVHPFRQPGDHNHTPPNEQLRKVVAHGFASPPHDGFAISM